MLEDLQKIYKDYKRNIVKIDFTINPQGAIFVIDKGYKKMAIITAQDGDDIIDVFETGILDWHESKEADRVGSINILIPNEFQWRHFQEWINSLSKRNRKKTSIGRVRYNKEGAMNMTEALTTDQAYQYIEDLPGIIKQEDKELNAQPTYQDERSRAMALKYWIGFMPNEVERLFMMYSVDGVSKGTMFKTFRSTLPINTIEDVDKVEANLKQKLKDLIAHIQATGTPIIGGK